jgi:hypothetical protein
MRGRTIDVEVPMTESIRVAEMALRGALVGEVMFGRPTAEKVLTLVNSLSLSSSSWKISFLSNTRFVLFELDMVDVEKLRFQTSYNDGITMIWRLVSPFDGALSKRPP